MENPERIEIQLSKSKLILLSIGAIVFVSLGIWFLKDPPKSNHPIFGNPTLIFITGIASIVLFGIIGVFIIKKLNDKSPGLIITNEGIHDNASGISAGFIPWSDILEIKVTIAANKPFINIVVKNPEDYIQKQKNPFLRKLVRINYNSFGTVIGIPSVALNCEFDELKKILNREFEKHKNQV